MRILLWSLWMCLCCYGIQAQSTRNDIKPSELPVEVEAVLKEYVSILAESSSLDICASALLKVAGGGLVDESLNEDGTALSLRSSVKRYALKKDYEAIGLYAQPVEITRVNVAYTNGSGFGESAVKGKVYKIWIAKKAGKVGRPAPITIVFPEEHDIIRLPKVTRIGSL